MAKMSSTIQEKKASKKSACPQEDPNIERIKQHLISQYRGSIVKFLWKVDDCYRFRINIFKQYDDWKIELEKSYFIHATITPDGIMTEEKKEQSKDSMLKRLGLL